MVPPAPDTVQNPKDKRTKMYFSYYLKKRYRPAVRPSKKPKELRWASIGLTSEPTNNTTPKYSDWDASSSLSVAVDILTHDDGVRYSGFEGRTSGLIALRTLLCLEQVDQVPTPTEGPRQFSDVIVDARLKSYAPRLHRLLVMTVEDPLEGVRPPPWLTPSLIPEGSTLKYTSSGNTILVRHNKTASFCPGPIIEGVV
jgi:hypothetical protein